MSGNGRARYADIIFFWTMAALVGAYVIARAVFVPFVHDEARTFFMFIQCGEVLPAKATPDAANHLLPSLVSLQLYRLFGAAPWVLRAFSVAGFAIYAWYVFRIGTWYRDRIVRWCVWPALLATPFVIEFFGLFRGYAPSVAFLVMFFWHGHSYMHDKRRWDLVLALLGVALAAYCNLALLLPWVGGVVLLGIPAVRGRVWRVAAMNGLVLTVLAVVPLIFLADHAASLEAYDKLYYGADHPWRGSLGSLALALTGHLQPWVLALPIALCFSMSLYRVFASGLEGALSPLVLLTLFVVIDMAGRIVMHLLWSMPLPLDRTGMHWIPPLILAVAQVIEYFASRWRPAALTALVLLYLPGHTIRAANMSNTVLWPDQSIPEQLVQAIAERTGRSAGPLWLYAPKFTTRSLAYEAYWRGWEIPLANDMLDPGPLHDLMLLAEIPTWSRASFTPLLRSEANGLWLLERKRPLRTQLLLDTMVQAEGTMFLDLWKGIPWQEYEGQLLIDVRARLFTEAPFRGDLVLSVDNDQGGHAFYHGSELCLIRDRWEGQELHVRLALPRRPVNGGMTRLYIWDPEERGMRVTNCRVQIRRPLLSEVDQ